MSCEASIIIYPLSKEVRTMAKKKAAKRKPAKKAAKKKAKKGGKKRL
ncbi:MAG: hypothetical protein RL272_1148 [Candidatus Parcubacteria bacterium]|jgi:hypothetical protein